jgi:hypothetical protein
LDCSSFTAAGPSQALFRSDGTASQCRVGDHAKAAHRMLEFSLCDTPSSCWKRDFLYEMTAEAEMCVLIRAARQWLGDAR